MKIKEFIERGSDSAIYPYRGNFEGFMYVTTGFAGEIGECFNLLNKSIRDDDWELTEEKRLKYIDELGGVTWFISQIMWELNHHTGRINVEKNLEDLFTPIKDVELYDVKNKIANIRFYFQDLIICANDIFLAEGEYIEQKDPTIDDVNRLFDIVTSSLTIACEAIGCICENLNISPIFVIEKNLTLLAKRKAAGTIKGSGDGVEDRC